MAKIGIKSVTVGLMVRGCVLSDGTERLFTWGTPWEVTAVEFSHRSGDHEYQGRQVPARDHFRLHARSADGQEQSIGVFADDEGVIPVDGGTA